ATAGQIATYGGRPITAYFSADCGGWTRSNVAAGLGNSPLPYLRPVKDGPAHGPDYCAVSPKHTWMRRLTATDILPRLNKKLGTQMQALKDIRFTQTYSDGRVGEVSIEGLGPLPKMTASAPASAP